MAPMGRFAILCAWAALIASPVLAEDAGAASLTGKAEACIAAAAPDAERLNASLSTAAQFLVEYLCAPQVGRREKFLKSSKELVILRASAESVLAGFDVDQTSDALPIRLKRMQDRRERLRDAYEKAYVDTVTGEIVMPPVAADIKAMATIGMDAKFTGAADDLRQFAGRAVLEARKTRLKSEGTPRPQ